MTFRTQDGICVPTVTADQMREVDRLAVEVFGLQILQMMENAGRNLAQNIWEMLDGERGPITVLAGSGGNGGGGLCCARHLHNRGFPVQVILDREGEALEGAPRRQLETLQAAGLQPLDPAQAEEAIRSSALIVDALIGYGLHDAPRGGAARLIDLCNIHGDRVLSLDVPSGLNATTGEAPGTVIHPQRTLTLALPKTGLERVSGALYLGDIGVPPVLYKRLGLLAVAPFGHAYCVPLMMV